jgi:hypothetical protein
MTDPGGAGCCEAKRFNTEKEPGRNTESAEEGETAGFE